MLKLPITHKTTYVSGCSVTRPLENPGDLQTWDSGGRCKRYYICRRVYTLYRYSVIRGIKSSVPVCIPTIYVQIDDMKKGNVWKKKKKTIRKYMACAIPAPHIVVDRSITFREPSPPPRPSATVRDHRLCGSRTN